MNQARFAPGERLTGGFFFPEPARFSIRFLRPGKAAKAVSVKCPKEISPAAPRCEASEKDQEGERPEGLFEKEAGF